jgi:hypothetical protein
VPNAIHFASAVPSTPFQQPTDLTYFSFVTLAIVGYGDAYPVHPAVRSLAVAEALVGQLYLAILIGSLVGMAINTRSSAAGGDTISSTPVYKHRRDPFQQRSPTYDTVDLAE